MDAEWARRSFGDVPLAHVGSVSPTGEPHVVPLWFVWLEDAVYVSCRRHSRVWTNLVNDPRVVLELERGRSWKDQAGILVHGEAEFLALDEPGARRAMSAWFDKYTRDLGGEHFAGYAEQVSTPALFRVRPKRVSWWDHRSPAS